MPRVICAGHVNWDVTLEVDRLPPADGEARIANRRQSGGGSASNVATALAGLGVSTTLLGSVGDDDHGRHVRRELRTAGVETRLVEVPDRETTVKYLVVDGDGEVMVLGNDGANEAFGPVDLPDGTLTDADHLHLTSQAPATADALAERADDAGATVSFDPGRRLPEREYGAVLANADVVFVNEREVDHATGDGSLADVATVVVKRGADGAEVRTEDGVETHQGFDVDAVDTTGAGDAFAAGFLTGRFEGDDESALRVANACGALATRTTGARVRVDRRDVDALLEGSAGCVDGLDSAATENSAASGASGDSAASGELGEAGESTGTDD